MAVTTDPFTATDLAGVIPEIWTPMVLEALFAKSVAANFFTDLSAYAQDGGDIFHVPDTYTNQLGSTGGTADSQSTQGAEITTASGAQNDVTLTINNHKYLAWIIGDKDMKQIAKGIYNINQVYTDQAAGILGHALEDALFGLWSGLSTNVVGDTATVLADAEIRTGINALHALNFNPMDCAFFFHPYTYWIQLGAVAKYYDASQAGSYGKAGFTRTGNFGEFNFARGAWGFLYGIPVYISSRVVSGLQTYRNLLSHPSALGFAVQTPSANGKVRVQANYELRNLGILSVVDMIYGVTELRDQAAVVLNGSSTFIGS